MCHCAPINPFAWRAFITLKKVSAEQAKSKLSIGRIEAVNPVLKFPAYSSEDDVCADDTVSGSKLVVYFVLPVAKTVFHETSEK